MKDRVDATLWWHMWDPVAGLVDHTVRVVAPMGSTGGLEGSVGRMAGRLAEDTQDPVERAEAAARMVDRVAEVVEGAGAPDIRAEDHREDRREDHRGAAVVPVQVGGITEDYRERVSG